MSEFTIGADEELRSLGEVIEDLRDRAGEMLGRIGTRMGFGEASIAYSIEDSEPTEDNGTAEMADENKEEEKKEEEGNGSGNNETSGHDSSTCTATVCSACGRGGGGKYFSAVPRKRK